MNGAALRPRSGSSVEDSLVEVALPVPVHQTFSYRIAGSVPPVGTRVKVPFRGRTMAGWVAGKGKKVPGLRRVVSVLDREPSVAGDLWELALWTADYYVTSLGLVLRAMLPTAMSDPSRQPAVARRSVVVVARQIGTLDEMQRVFGKAKRQQEAYERLQEAGGRQPLEVLLENGFGRHLVRGMEKRGVVAVESEAVSKDPFRDRPAGPAPKLLPTPDQRSALERLRGSLGRGGGTFLLHGVTGSGKTLVYVEFLRDVLDRGEGAVVLVPEIALTPQTVARFRRAFGDLVAVLHSGLSSGERYDAWRQLKSGEKRVAIGARSAVFAPVARLGAVVVDEEHDGSYKQTSPSPRYSARDLAVVRAAQNGGVCVLGSATPALESWANAASRKYRLLSLPDRVGGGVLPQVRLVDLRRKAGAEGSAAEASAPGRSVGAGRPETSLGSASDRASADAPPRPSSEPPPQVLSPVLLKAMRLRLERKEQTILLLNRRGYANFALCQECGDVKECVRCSVSMTLHRGRGRLACHHCGHDEPPPRRCSRCGAPAISYRGLGTEQVERIVVECLPGARVARMDVDTTGGKWSHHEILGRLRDGTVDILLGTQMIAKGLDFPRVTLVGVIDADVGLHMPDFRSCERTFHLLAQVAGRAGRGALPGEVVIQTRVPDHYVVRAALAHDYVGFVKRELGARTDPPYPPHVRMARMLVTSPVQTDAMAAAEALADWLKAWTARGGLEVLGPAPAPIERIKGRYRWHVLVRGRAGPVGRALRAVAGGFAPKGAGVRVALDRDPLHLM